MTSDDRSEDVRGPADAKARADAEARADVQTRAAAEASPDVQSRPGVQAGAAAVRARAGVADSDLDCAYQPIENYGIIGDLHTCALVGMDGSIDLMCFPRFDSPSVFAALLDRRKGGRFQIRALMDGARSRQLYLPDTCVLLTRFLSDHGVAEISDFMAVNEETEPHTLVRRVKVVRGRVRFRVLCQPRFDYARAEHRVEARAGSGRSELCGGEVLFVSLGPDRMALRLRSTLPLQVRGGDAVAEFVLGEGETAAFTLEDARPHKESPTVAERYVPEAFKDTTSFWRRWISHCAYKGRWREIVNRSALTLKLMTSHEHGSMVAAASFGLPEDVGGIRNWDYRYTWIRDASFTLYALIRLGFTAEAGAFMRWIEARCYEASEPGTLQIVYGIDGRHDLTEVELPHLEGYRGSSPVRIGNAAFQQLQLDIYGELLDSVYLYNKYGEPISHDLWTALVRIVDWVCTNWHQPDQGIWEVRAEPRHFLFSRLMCWVAVDRGIRLAMKRSLPCPMERWQRARDAIYDDLWRSFWHPARAAFVEHAGSSGTDAAALLMPLVKFVAPTDPRWLSTLRAIESDLVDDSLVFRYRDQKGELQDGLPGTEGTFSMCSFWYVECLSRAGDLEKARFLFEKMLGYANHVGLYSEELGPAGQHLGNHPQAFTHLALISAAHNLDLNLRHSGRD